MATAGLAWFVMGRPSPRHTIQAFSSTKAMQSFGVTVQGCGASVQGEMGPGTITTYDYTAIYSVYSLKSSDNANYWFVSYHKDTSQDVLEKTFEEAQTATVPFDVKGAASPTGGAVSLPLDGVGENACGALWATSGSRLPAEPTNGDKEPGRSPRGDDPDVHPVKARAEKACL